MVAAEYFDLRSNLGAALFSLGRVAELAGLKPSRTPIVKSLVEGLRDPFVFVVAGEVNTGKSTLLNALFGEEFCPSSVLPETQCIHYFRYGRSPRRTAVSAVLEEIELPHSFLRDFHVVDTPGVNCLSIPSRPGWRCWPARPVWTKSGSSPPALSPLLNGSLPNSSQGRLRALPNSSPPAPQGRPSWRKCRPPFRPPPLP